MVRFISVCIVLIFSLSVGATDEPPRDDREPPKETEATVASDCGPCRSRVAPDEVLTGKPKHKQLEELQALSDKGRRGLQKSGEKTEAKK